MSLITHKPRTQLGALFLAAEAHPFIKVGGLGDYAGSLPQAIQSFADDSPVDVDLRVILPFHDELNLQGHKLQKTCDIRIPKRDGFAFGSVYDFSHNNVHYYLIKRKGHAKGYQSVYNTRALDDARKYVFFSAACIHFLKQVNWKPHIIHANDWHTAVAIKVLADLKGLDPFYRWMKSILVVHNLPFFGEGSQSVLKEYGIGHAVSETFPQWAKTLPLPVGLEAADQIVTVSPTYANELRQSEFGNGLEAFFTSNREKVTGILNGIDYEEWDPLKDNHIFSNFSAHQIGPRSKNKELILEQMGFGQFSEQPLFVLISRLTYQKGIDLILEGLPMLVEQPWTAIFLGKGQAEYEDALTRLQNDYPERIRYFPEYNDRLARQLYAAGDMLLMPSLYEPCGLSQMIAMRYGCVPVARAVGGLKDSIISDDQKNKDGYLFSKSDPSSFVQCLRQAISDFSNKHEWTAIQQRGMLKDFSWQVPAKKYIDLYSQLSLP